MLPSEYVSRDLDPKPSSISCTLGLGMQSGVQWLGLPSGCVLMLGFKIVYTAANALQHSSNSAKWSGSIAFVSPL